VISITDTSIEQQQYSEPSRCGVAVYRIFKQTLEGEFVHVTTRQELEHAVQVVEAFNLQWPAQYVVRDLEGNDVYRTDLGTIHPTPRRLSGPRTKPG